MSWRRKGLLICKPLFVEIELDKKADDILSSFWDNVGGEVCYDVHIFFPCCLTILQTLDIAFDTAAVGARFIVGPFPIRPVFFTSPIHDD